MKLDDTEFSVATRKDTDLVDFLNSIYNLINNGRYQMRVVSSVPTWVGDEGEHLLYVSGTVRRFYWYDITNSTWQFIEWNNSGGGQATLVASAVLTSQTATINATTLYTPSAAGLFRVSVYHVVTTAGGGSLTTAVIWTDDAQAQTTTPAANINLANLGEAASGTSFIRATASAIQYSSTIGSKTGSPVFALFITVERLV